MSGIASVMTVTGPRPAAELGATLMHEHILNDCACWWHPPRTPERMHLADSAVDMPILSELRQDPFVCRHNLALDEEALAVEELARFVDAGGRTVVDPTCRGIGRNPAALVRISRATGLNIVMGAGYYLHSSHPSELAAMSADAVAEQIEREALDGISPVADTADATGEPAEPVATTTRPNRDTAPRAVDAVRIGLIGEIGVSSDFTSEERKSLVGAARAQVRTGLPLMVHLPGWFRLGGEVLDLVEAEGVDPRRVVLCHMNPSHADADYQIGLARRGAFIEYDMIGMDYFYGDQQVQCPSDEEAARGIARLAEAGFLDRVLLSQDVFLKMMLTRYGGNGYAFVQRHFLPRLARHGFDGEELDSLLTCNPRSVFDPSFRGTKA